MINLQKTALLMIAGLLALGLGGCDDEVSTTSVFERDIYIIETYLSEQGITDYETTESGIYYHVLEEGTDEVLAAEEIGWIGYEGRLPYGYIFDSSFLRGDTLKVQQGTGLISSGYTEVDCDTLSTDPLELENCTQCPQLSGGVIRGWVEALSLLHKEERVRFYFPSYLGYGSNGSGEYIPGNSVLIFDMELYGGEFVPANCEE